MSLWTHIVGTIHVDTCKCVANTQKYVEDALKDAPEITGDEGSAAVFVNTIPVANHYTSCDCDVCQYKDTIQHIPDPTSFGTRFTCEAPDDYECPIGEYKTCVVITVCGDLRDRTRSQTKKEWNAFHRYIAKNLGFTIRNATCRIEGW